MPGGAWADSGSQARLGRRLGRLRGNLGVQDGANLGPKMAPSWGQNRARLKKRLGRLQRDLGGQDGPNLRPKMAPSWSQDRTKIDVQIDHFFDAFKNFFLMIFDGFLEGKWREVGTKIGSKIDVILKTLTTAKLL